MNRFEEILSFIAEYFGDEDNRYVIVGGVAVMYHGVPRTTVDIDLIIKMEESDTRVFMEFLISKGLRVDIDSAIELLEEGSHCTIFTNGGLLRLDLQYANSFFDSETLRRAILVNHLKSTIRLGSVEDTLLNKILFSGEQDIRDAIGIFARHRDELDYDYMKKTSRELGILEDWICFKDKYSQEKIIRYDSSSC